MIGRSGFWFLVALCVLAIFSSSARAEPRAEWVDAPLRDRGSWVYMPSDLPDDEAAPLVICLHGLKFGASNWSPEGPLDTCESLGLTLDEVMGRGWRMATPSGTRWAFGQERPDSGSTVCWHVFEGMAECDSGEGNYPNDVDFIDALTTGIQLQYATNRVFVWGHSNGGALSAKYVCERASRLDAAGMYNGSNNEGTEFCPDGGGVLFPYAPRPSLFVATDLANVASLPGRAQQFAEFQGCDPEPEITKKKWWEFGKSRKETRVWTCPEGSAVEYWRETGGHNSPAPISDTFDWFVENTTEHDIDPPDPTEPPDPPTDPCADCPDHCRECCGHDH